jgi:hypothetical protein
MPLNVHDSEEICEALVRHVEVSGFEVFEKNFDKDGRTACTVWCVVGENADVFKRMVHRWLDEQGFNLDR